MNDSFWLDEAAQALESLRPLKEQLQIAYDFQPPLYHLLVHFISRFCAEEWWLRLASVIPGIITVVAVYAISQRLFAQKKLGLLAPLLLATSSFHIFFSQELRPYALAAMFGTLSWLFLLKWEESKNEKNFWTFCFLSILGVYTMYVYLFLSASQLLYLWLFIPKKRKLLLLGVASIALLFLPWMPMFLQQMKVGTHLQQQLPGWSSVVSAPQSIVLAHLALRFIGGVQTFNNMQWEYIYFGAPILLLLILFVHSIKIALGNKKEHLLFRVVFFWFFLPIFASWLFSFILPVLSPKRALFSLPGFFIFVTAVTMYLRPKLQYFVAGFFLMINVIGILLYWSSPLLQREGWREALSVLQKSYSAENTVAVFGFYEPFAPWNYYKDELGIKFSTVAVAAERAVDPATLDISMKPTLAYSNVLVFDYLRDLSDPGKNIERWLDTHGYQEKTPLDTKNIGFIRLFQKEMLYSFSGN